MRNDSTAGCRAVGLLRYGVTWQRNCIFLPITSPGAGRELQLRMNPQDHGNPLLFFTVTSVTPSCATSVSVRRRRIYAKYVDFRAGQEEG